MKKYFVLTFLFVLALNFTFAQTENKQFIYVLHLVPKYLDTKIWTDTENKAVNDHFERLKKMTAEGIVLLAGKTENWDEKMFGIVIFHAESFEKAKEIAENDPAVKAGVMTVETYPYKMALIQERFK